MSDEQPPPEAMEAFCVRDRQRVVMNNPTPVWTRRSMPATRGDCPICGGSVFRLGNTPAHEAMARPEAININEPKARRAKLAPDSVYIDYAADDSEFALQLSADLERLRMAHWLHEAEPDGVQWAGGTHPALKECGRMVLIASPSAGVAHVIAAWQFFRQKHKPIMIAQIDGHAPPDLLRRAPRFDFGGDYKLAFRGLLRALNE